jgi:hypothetical protein
MEGNGGMVMVIDDEAEAAVGVTSVGRGKFFG